MSRPWRDVTMIGTGPDGTSYAALDEHGARVTLHRLVQATDERKAELRRRFDLLARAAPAHMAEIRSVDLDTGIIVVARGGRTLADALAKAPISRDLTLRFGLGVAAALHAAHDGGVWHGALGPHHIDLDDTGLATVDLTGLATGHADPLFARACTAPERRDDHVTLACDVFSLGVLLLAADQGLAAVARLPAGAEAATTDGKPRSSAAGSASGSAPANNDPPLLTLIKEMTDHEPAWRPSMAEVQTRLMSLAAVSTIDVVEDETLTTADADEGAPREDRIGRFRMFELIGEGAMGKVYRAEDLASGTQVALKVIGRDGGPSPRAIRRFKKEARILAELKNPGIAALIDAGEDNGRLYIACELVAGTPLSQVIKERGPLPEDEALAIIADVARAMLDVHAADIVHRDIKPENVLMVSAQSANTDGVAGARGSRIKLIDFGISRHLDETESLAMTRVGAVLGTPLYMAPEQARGEAVTAATDVYALGCVLFELLCGRTPFVGHGASLVIAMQIDAQPPRVDELRGDVSDAVSRLVSRCLEKEARARPKDARALLDEILRITDRQSKQIGAHPAAPTDARVLTYTWEWQLPSTPEQLWPYVSNTDRLNRAIGLGAVEETFLELDGELARFGRSKQAGFELKWREHPFEWVYARRLGILREYSDGPLRWLRSTVDLVPEDGGTKLRHVVSLEPRGLLGRAAAAVEVGVRSKRALERVYKRIDELIQHGESGRDAFGEAHALSSDREHRLTAIEKKTVAAGADPDIVARLGDFLRSAPAMDVARIRPLALARRLGTDESATLRACFIAAHEGMLAPLWDLLCPTCRAPAGIEETLRALREHGRCEVCNIDFALDLSTTIELVFRVHPQIREADVGTYCLGSPIKTPHVMAQVRLAPAERFVFEMALADGGYQLVGKRLPYTLHFRVRGDCPTTRWEFPLREGPPADLPRLLGGSRQEIVVVNDTGKEQLLRIERTAQRDDVLTAARVAAHPLFRRLFPNEVLKPGALVRITSVTLLCAQVHGAFLIGVNGAAASALKVDGEGDQRAFTVLYAAFRALEEQVASAGGALVKILGDGVLAVFDEPSAALRAALQIPEAIARVAPSARVRMGVHRGQAAAVTLNDRLDYFGRSVFVSTALAHAASDNEVALSESALADPLVKRLLEEQVQRGAVASASGATDRFKIG